MSTHSKARSRFGRAAALATAFVVLHVLWIRLGIGGAFATQAFSDLVVAVAPLAAACACWTVARRERGPARRGWALLGAAAASWAAGEIAWSVYELILRVEVPFPSAADAGYLAMIPLAAAGILSFPSAPRAITSRIRTLLDALLISGSLLFVSWSTVLGPVSKAADGSVLERFLGLAYPAGDVILIAAVLFVAARAARGGRFHLGLIGAGLVGLSLADSGFTFLTLKDAYAAGNPIDVGWTCGFLLLALGALRALGRPGADAEHKDRTGALGTWLPYGTLILAIAVAAAEEILDGALEPFLFWNAFAVVLAVVLRQLVTIRENLDLTRNLEAKVQGRTAELEAVIRRLGEVQRLQDTFVSNVSHELRTPVTKLIASSRMLKRLDLGLTEEALELADMADRSATRLAVLVEDLLVAAGLGDDGSSGSRSPFNVAAEVRAVLGDCRPEHHRIRTSIPQTLIALGDPARSRVVLTHLLSNAEKFSPRGSAISVDVSIADGSVDLVIGDEGPGIPRAYRQKVFERFFQIDGSATRSQGGAGLGLYVAKELAESMGGSLSIDEVPRGASLRFRLPALEGAVAPARSA